MIFTSNECPCSVSQVDWNQVIASPPTGVGGLTVGSRGRPYQKLSSSRVRREEPSLVRLEITVSQKNSATFIFTVTLANVGRFLKFFQCRNQKEMAHNKNEKFPTVA